MNDVVDLESSIQGVNATLWSQVRLSPGSELPGGFSIHAGVRIEGDGRGGREQLLMYAARPAFSEVQLSLLEDDVVELAVVDGDDEAAGGAGLRAL